MYSWIFVNLANVLFALAYLVKDMFWLRLISIVACTANMAYLYLAPDKPLWWGIGWDLVFVLINAVQIVVLVKEHRAVQFGQEERELFEAVFSQLSPLEFNRILSAAHWLDFPADGVLTREDEQLPWLMVIYRGTARVERGGRVITVLKPGDFVGEMSFVAANAASATVVAADPIRVLCWDKERLRRILAGDQSLKLSLESVLSFNMADKLKRQG